MTTTQSSQSAAERARQEMIRRIQEHARQEAARKKAEAQRQAEAQKQQAAAKANSQFQKASTAAGTRTATALGASPGGEPLPASVLQAYRAVSKAVTEGKPGADAHQVIANSPALQQFIADSSVEVELATAQKEDPQAVNQALEGAAREVTQLATASQSSASVDSVQRFTQQSNSTSAPAAGSATGTSGATAAPAPAQPAAAAQAQEAAKAQQAATAQAQMQNLLEIARNNASGQPPMGECYRAVYSYIEQAGSYGELPQKGDVIPSRFARYFADYLNEGDNAAQMGLQRLNIDNPYDAPAGSIVVVRPGTPGTAHPEAGDIVVAGGDGTFYNDGEMGYGGPDNFPPGNDFVLGVYAPTGAAGAGAFDAGSPVKAEQLSKVMPNLPPDQAQAQVASFTQAMQSAGISSPKQAAAFVAAAAEATQEMSAPQSAQFVAELGTKWKALGLSAAADAEDYGSVRSALGITAESASGNAADDLSGFASDQYDGMIRQMAAKHGVPARLVKSMMEAESNFDPNALSSAGAMGLIQLMPGTFDAVAQRHGLSGSPSDPLTNIEAGTLYIKEQLESFGGNVELALAAYNAGPGAVQEYGNSIPPYAETQNYVSKIMARYNGETMVSLNPYYQRAQEAYGIARKATQASRAGGASAGGGYASAGGGGAANQPNKAPTTAPPGITPKAEPSPFSNPAQEARIKTAITPTAQGFQLDVEDFWKWMKKVMSTPAMLWRIESDPEFAKFARENGMPDFDPGEIPTTPEGAALLEELKARFLAMQLAQAAAAAGGGAAGLQSAAESMMKSTGPLSGATAAPGASPPATAAVSPPGTATATPSADAPSADAPSADAPTAQAPLATSPESPSPATAEEPVSLEETPADPAQTASPNPGVNSNEPEELDPEEVERARQLSSAELLRKSGTVRA